MVRTALLLPRGGIEPGGMEKDQERPIFQKPGVEMGRPYLL